MAEAPIMPFATDAFVADTTHLTAEQTGAYVMLLFCMWRSPNATLPLDHKRLCRMARVNPKRWSAVWDEISGFFIIEADLISQKRLQIDRIRIQERIIASRLNGSLGGRPKILETLDEDKPRGFDLNNLDGTQTLTQTEPRQKLSISISKSRKKEVTPLVPLGGEKQSRGTRLPDNFPDEWCMARAIDYWAKHHRADIDVAEQAVQFRAHHEARGTTSKKWPASWQTWYMNALKFSRPGVKAKTGFGDIFNDLRSRGVME